MRKTTVEKQPELGQNPLHGAKDTAEQAAVSKGRMRCKCSGKMGIILSVILPADQGRLVHGGLHWQESAPGENALTAHL